jgi:hypothetical protein
MTVAGQRVNWGQTVLGAILGAGMMGLLAMAGNGLSAWATANAATAKNVEQDKRLDDLAKAYLDLSNSVAGMRSDIKNVGDGNGRIEGLLMQHMRDEKQQNKR